MASEINDDDNLLTVLATCTSGTCPTVYTRASGDIVVQGYIEEIGSPDGEQAVSIPREVLMQAASALVETR
jgi:hypothetical protein